jgi:tetratricopeptide (TPR) repeat protein
MGARLLIAQLREISELIGRKNYADALALANLIPDEKLKKKLQFSCLLNLGRYDDAEKIELTEEEDTFHLRGILFLKQNRFEDAFAEFKKSLEIRPRRQQRLSKKKLKALRKEKRARMCIKMAEQLNKTPPASEVWFHKKFNEEKIKRIYGCYKKGKFIDMCNEPFFDYYIPDIVNHGYRYIIEVDGEIHNNLKQAYKDLAKDQYYRKRHYRVFRVKAHDDESYNKFIVDFKEYLEVQHTVETILS